MDADLATRFITSLTKSLQAVIHGCLDFDKDIELGGYVYLKVDNAERIDYVLSEKMLKSDLNSMTFHSNSFHALPQPSQAGSKVSKEKNVSASSSELSGKSASSGRVHSASTSESPMYSTTQSAGSASTSHQNLPLSHTQNSDSFMHPKSAPRDEFQISGSMKLHPSSNKSATASSSESFRSKNRSLTDFQTAFRNPSTSLSSPLHQSSSTHNWSPSHNGSSSRSSSSHTAQQQQQQQSKSSILPDPSDMEVVHVKTEEEDDVFNIPLQCHQGGPESDGFAAQGKASWLAMRMRQPFYFPYPRLARSQSFDQRMNMARSNPRFPFFSGESNSETTSLTCKVCGKCYRSRQGLLFHERAKHQNVFNVYCPVCGKGFQQTTHMYGHMATHTNIKNFQCQACGAKYAHKTSLQQHLRSGSCRASHVNNPAGLDLSTSQLLRDFTPYNLTETQSRPSPSHSQSPLESADANSTHSQADRDMSLNENRLSTFGQASQLDNDLDGCENLDSSSHKTAHPSIPRGVPGGSFDSPDDDGVLGQGMSSYGSLSGSVPGAQDCGDVVFPSRGDPRELMNSREIPEGLNLISREDTRGSTTTGSPSPETLGIDMTKDTHAYDNAGSGSTVCDDSLNKQETLYEHDSDVPGTVSLSFSADDD